MIPFDINSCNAYREHNRLEAKSAKGGFPGSFWETYSAFANTDGGVIILGVKEYPDGSLHPEAGIDTEKLHRDFWNMVNNRQKISANIVTERMVSVEAFENNPILVVRVPRAERSAKPVYVGQDPKSGTYRRNHEGDYHCSIDEVSLMFRDASAVTQDTKVLEGMDYSVFCQETIKGYRNFFRTRHSNHLWNNEDDEMFLRKIGAISIGKDGLYHPTSAGLLMFGYEYEITREFPNFFLDYQENRSTGITRWTDRLVSTSGDWSGNIFDFVIQVLRRMQQGLKVPFVLQGNQRVDDTPIHKLLREAVTNACVHADFYGRQGLVFQKSTEGYIISNPGSVRISISEAIDGGISDPRNSVMLKMFSLIDFGERAGSGLNEICTIWKTVFHTPATLKETHDHGVDRTILTLLTGDNEPDVEAMIRLYRVTPQTDSNTTQTSTQTTVQRKDNTTQTTAQREEKAKSYLTELQLRILTELEHNSSLSRKELSKIITNASEYGIKYNLKRLQMLGYLKREGADFGGSWRIIKSFRRDNIQRH